MEVSGDKSVTNVELPEWSHSHEDFCCTMRAALESDIVSDSLNSWIDLIFGCNQNSLESHNNFSPESYDLDWNDYKTELKKNSALTLLKEYGVMPTKIFNEPSEQKLLKIQVMSDKNSEQKSKLQKLLNQVQNMTQVHNKEFKAQEKQYKQLIVQETQEKNQELQELKGELAALTNDYMMVSQELDGSFRPKNENSLKSVEPKRLEMDKDSNKGSEGRLQNVRSLEGSLKDRKKDSQKKLQSK